jgi:O-antigen ligase
VWVGKMVYERRHSFSKTPLDLFFVLYLVVESISAVLSFYPPQAWEIWIKRIFLLPIVYIISTQINDEQKLRRSLYLFLASSVLVSLLGVYDISQHWSEYLGFQERLGLFQYPLTASGIMMYALLFIVACAANSVVPKKIRIISLVAFIPMFINLIFTFSRSSWFGFLGGAFFIAFMRMKKLALILIAIILLFGIFAPPAMQDRALSSFDPYHPNNAPRLTMWKVGINIFHHNPFFGIGDIGIERVYHLYAPPEAEREGHLHNNVVMWLATIGGIGAVLLISMFAFLFFKQYKIYQHVTDRWLESTVMLGALASAIAFQINGLFEWNFGDAEIIMIIWMMTGWTFGISSYIKR